MQLLGVISLLNDPRLECVDSPAVQPIMTPDPSHPSEASSRARSRGLELASTFALACSLSVASVLVPSQASAAPTPSGQISSKGGNFGLGLSVGDPTGLSMKLFLHPNHALQWGLGWGPFHYGAGRLHMDYLWHPGTMARTSVMDLVGYVGVGAGLVFWAHRYYWGCGYAWHRGYGPCGHGGGAAFMIRVPDLGLAFHWKKVPLDLAVEAAWTPLIGAWGFDAAHADFMVACRYYF